jgi:hypothetical protein
MSVIDQVVQWAKENEANARWRGLDRPWVLTESDGRTVFTGMDVNDPKDPIFAYDPSYNCGTGGPVSQGYTAISFASPQPKNGYCALFNFSWLSGDPQFKAAVSAHETYPFPKAPKRRPPDGPGPASSDDESSSDDGGRGAAVNTDWPPIALLGLGVGVLAYTLTK